MFYASFPDIFVCFVFFAVADFAYNVREKGQPLKPPWTRVLGIGDVFPITISS